MTTQQLIVRDFHGATIRQRSDGYLNATDMCQSTGKRLNDYRRLKTTKEFFNVLSGYAGIPADLIIQITKTGPNNKRGTWIESHASINLAQWCSPEFAVMVTDWVFELLTEGSVSLNPAQTKQEEIAACAKVIAACAKVESDLLESFGITGNAKQIALNNILKKKFGYDALEAWDLESPIPEAPKVLLIPTDIAKRVGLHNAIPINLKLTELGLQTKHRDNKKRLYYVLTEEGLKHGQYQDTGKSKKPGQLARAIRWYESVLTLF